MESWSLPTGREMPMLGFGTWTLEGETCAEMVKTAIEAG